MMRRSGASLLEVLVVTSMFATAALTAFFLLTNELQFLPRSRTALQAIGLAEEGLEAARSIRDQAWTDLAPGTHGLVFPNATWSFHSTSETMDGFTRIVTVTDLAANERRVDATIRWMGSLGRTETFTLSTTLANWRNAFQTRLFGDWRIPRTLGTIDLGPGNEGRSLAVHDRFVYMAAMASDENKPDFFVIDATSSTHPIIRGRLNTGPGLNAVAVRGPFAYVANDDETAQLQIINIANTSTPTLIQSFRLGNNSEEGTAIVVSGTLVYIATEKEDNNPEFYVVDVSNPTAPSVIGSLNIGATVNDMFIYGSNVYLATASNTRELLIVDATNPTHPVVTGFADLPGTAVAVSVYVNDQDNHAYVTRRQASGATTPELVILDVSNPRAPRQIGSLELSADIRSVFAADTLGFLGTALSSQELHIYNVSNPASLTFLSGLNFPQVAHDIAFENNILYVAVRSNDALRMITSQ